MFGMPRPLFALIAFTLTAGCSQSPTTTQAEVEQPREEAAELASLKAQHADTLELLESYKEMSDAYFLQIEVLTELIRVGGIDPRTICGRDGVVCKGDTITFTVTETEYPHRHTVEAVYTGTGNVKRIDCKDTEYLD